MVAELRVHLQVTIRRCVSHPFNHVCDNVAHTIRTNVRDHPPDNFMVCMYIVAVRSVYIYIHGTDSTDGHTHHEVVGWVVAHVRTNGMRHVITHMIERMRYTTPIQEHAAMCELIDEHAHAIDLRAAKMCNKSATSDTYKFDRKSPLNVQVLYLRGA